MLSGEILSIVEVIDFTTKTELLEKLRAMREGANNLADEDRHIVKEMLGVAIQEVYFTPGKEIMGYKHYLNFKRNKVNKENAKNGR